MFMMISSARGSRGSQSHCRCSGPSCRRGGGSNPLLLLVVILLNCMSCRRPERVL